MLDSNKVNKFINAALKYKGDKYSQPRRMEPGYSDCSSLIYKGLRDTGLLDSSQTSRTISTKYMRDGDPRFIRIDNKDLKRGDILWWQKPGTTDKNYSGHVGIYLGDNKVLEAIYAGVDIHPKSRLAWQRTYRIKTLIADKPNTIVNKDIGGEVTAKVLNVRDKDGTSGRVVGKLRQGEKVDITGQSSNGWYRIKYKSKDAYVSNLYIKEVKKVIENVPILINEKEIKKGYIIDGVTYININGKDLPARRVFEGIGAKVIWQDNKVKISL